MGNFGYGIMKTKIIFISPQLYPDFIGGIEVFNYYLIIELGKYFDVSFMKIFSCNSSEIDKKAKSIPLKGQKSILRLFEIIWYLVKKSKKYNVIVTSFSRTRWYYILIYPLMKLIFSIDYIIVIHGGGLTPWKWKWPYNLYFRLAKKVIGVSNIICIEYKRRVNIEIELIPPLLPFRLSSMNTKELRDREGIEIDSKVFLYVGSLKKLKRPEVILHTLRTLNNGFLQNNKVLCLFAGDGPMKSELLTFAKKYKLVRYVKFLGNCERNRVQELYKLANYYIISSDFEGTPISLMEAYFNKLPVLASNVSGINSIVNKNTGILFDNNSTNSLSEAMQEVINSNEYCNFLTENGSKYYSEHFNYENLLAKYNEILKS